MALFQLVQKSLNNVRKRAVLTRCCFDSLTWVVPEK